MFKNVKLQQQEDRMSLLSRCLTLYEPFCCVIQTLTLYSAALLVERITMCLWRHLPFHDEGNAFFLFFFLFFKL